MISVCMATYNGEDYIREQLDSILQQVSSTDEIIISDDGSTDSTLDIIKAYDNANIRLINNGGINSPVRNFENALNYSRGDIVLLSDQDDVWMWNKVDTIKQYMKKYDLVLSDADVIDENGVVIGDSFYRINCSKSGLINNLIKNSYLGCSMAFNRKILDKALPFPDDLPMHDWWIGLIGNIYGETYFIDKKLFSYRRHSSNVSCAGKKSSFSLAYKIWFRYVILKSIASRYFRFR
jgi:glycosyltransferase involved in cell wall biosynthesis